MTEKEVQLIYVWEEWRMYAHAIITYDWCIGMNEKESGHVMQERRKEKNKQILLESEWIKCISFKYISCKAKCNQQCSIA
jgi:hypothetical protein